MRNSYKILVIILLIMSNQTFAQQYKFGKISKEELLEKIYPSDSSANAAILYESKNVTLEYNGNEFELITEVFKRVKIYNKKGFDYASEEISLFKRNSEKEKVSSLKGITYSLEGGEMIETKLKKDGIFENEMSKDYNQIKFTMPSLKEGSVIEYKYKITSPFFYNIDKVYLQYGIPVKKMKVKINTPEYFNFKKFSTGYLPINLKEIPYRGTFIHKTESEITSQERVKGSSQSIEFDGTSYNIESKNVPALKKEPFSGNTENYISSLVLELASTSFPNSPINNYSSTWGDVINTVYNNPKFGGELKKNNYYKEDIDGLIAGVTKPEEKVFLIYNFVREKMTWNKKRRIFTKQGVKKAYKENIGNTSEINLMLTSMITYAGINANPVIGSTSDRAIALFPTIDGFNYVVTRVKLEGKEPLYLDATDKYGVPNILPNRIIRGMGRVIAKNGTSQLVSFRPEKPSKSMFRIQCEIDEEGITKGVFGVTYKDHIAHDFRVNNAIKNEESKIKRFEKKYGITELEEYSVKGVKEYGKGVNERFNFAVEDEIEVIEDEMFFSPLLFLRDKENIFKTDDRKYPIDFGYGFSNRYMVSIKIPEGYKVLEYPKGSSFKLPDDMGMFSFKSSLINGTFQVIVVETIKTSIIPVGYYPAIKEFYNQVIQKENEQVVLKKM